MFPFSNLQIRFPTLVREMVLADVAALNNDLGKETYEQKFDKISYNK
jgi:hypothetical protein